MLKVKQTLFLVSYEMLGGEKSEGKIHADDHVSSANLPNSAWKWA